LTDITRFIPGFSWLRLTLVGLALVAVAAAAWKVYHTIDRGGYNRAVAEQVVAAAKQIKENQERARFVEKEFITREIVRTKVITKVQKELPDATKNLVACVLSDSAIGLLNNAARAVKPATAASGG
jgi:hypothetical protein